MSAIGNFFRTLTLVELLIILAICGILAAVALPGVKEYRGAKSGLINNTECVDGKMRGRDNALIVYNNRPVRC